MIKSLSRILFMLFAFLLSIEVVWFSCEPFQRQQLLEALGRDDLAREIQLDPYYPILSQLYQLRMEDHEGTLEKVQQEHEAEQRLKREQFKIQSKNNTNMEQSDSDVMNVKSRFFTKNIEGR